MLLSEIDEYSVKILVSIGVNARSKFNSYNRLEIGRLPDHFLPIRFLIELRNTFHD